MIAWIGNNCVRINHSEVIKEIMEKFNELLISIYYLVMYTHPKATKSEDVRLKGSSER